MGLADLGLEVGLSNLGGAAELLQVGRLLALLGSFSFFCNSYLYCP